MVDDVNDRKKRILKAIIHEHILTAEPVGSRTLAKAYELGVSSATIRNEMSDLEEMGLIEQPYTSAGRVPSDIGYRFYVDSLINEGNNFSLDLETKLKNFHYEKEGIQNIISGMARMLSQITRYTSIVSEPKQDKCKIKKLQLIPVEAASILILLITDTGLVHNKVVKLNKALDVKKINYINRFFADYLEGKVVKDVEEDLLEEVEKRLVNKLNISHDLLKMIYKGMKILSQPEDVKIHLDGTSYILEQPEFNDLRSLKKVLHVLEREEILKKIFNKTPDKELEVMIGKENELEEMKKCSIVFATYNIKDVAKGKVGVIGPTRMEYSRVIASVNQVADILSNIISELSR